MELSRMGSLMRRNVAVVCWFAVAGTLITSGSDVGTIFQWRELVFLLWVVARIGFLAYAGILLWDADQEIVALKQARDRLEEIIAGLQGSCSRT
jgi:hypothetical protein